MLNKDPHPGMRPGDVFVTLDDSGLGKGETPLCERLYLKTEDGTEELDGSALLYAKQLRLAVSLHRCSDKSQFERPLEERGEELAKYRQASCVFLKNPDPDSNFYQVEQAGSGTLWIYNKGKRSLRFRTTTTDQLLYRVCAGTIQPLTPSNSLARIKPPTILLDVDSRGGPIDIQIQAVHVLDRGTWQRGDVYLHCGGYTDSYQLRVQYRDDCLGLFEAYSSYFMGRSALNILDIDSYGPADWHIRNLGGEPLRMDWDDRDRCTPETRWTYHAPSSIPADRAVYPLAQERLGLKRSEQLEQEALLS